MLAYCSERMRDLVRLLRVEVQVCAVDLVESPEQVLCSAVDVVSARIVWKVVCER